MGHGQGFSGAYRRACEGIAADPTTPKYAAINIPMLVSDGDDIRRLPLSMRKINLALLLARRLDGIFLSDFEQGEIGPDLFRHACLMGLEGRSSAGSIRAVLDRFAVALPGDAISGANSGESRPYANAPASRDG